MQQQRGYAQQRGGVRNPGYGPSMAQPSNEAALRQRLQHEEAVKRKEQQTQQRILHRPSDRNIPDEVAQCTIGDGVERYKKLRDMERRLDATMMQKRLDLTDPYRQRTETEGTLRIWISNTAEGQPWQVMEEHNDSDTFDLADNSQATYRVKIEGRLLEEPTEEDKQADTMKHEGADAKEASKSSQLRFSDYFRAIKIDFDRPPSLQADGVSTIEWKRPSHPNDPNKPRLPNPAEASFNTLEFTRKGDEEINITVSLYLDHSPPRYRLSPLLASLLSLPEADTATVLGAIWDYVRHHQLQEDDEQRRFICDEPLRAIFGLEVLSFPQLREIILTQNHLSELAPIQLPYTIRLDKEYLSAPTKTVHDVLVPLPSPLDAAVKALASDPAHVAKLRQIQDVDADIAVLIQALSRATQKHKFLSSLSEDPVRFVRRWVGSQKRDLEIFLAEGGRGFGEDAPLPDSMRRGGPGGVWGTEGVREAAGVYLARSTTR